MGGRLFTEASNLGKRALLGIARGIGRGAESFAASTAGIVERIPGAQRLGLGDLRERVLAGGRVLHSLLSPEEQAQTTPEKIVEFLGETTGQIASLIPGAGAQIGLSIFEKIISGREGALKQAGEELAVVALAGPLGRAISNNIMRAVPARVRASLSDGLNRALEATGRRAGGAIAVPAVATGARLATGEEAPTREELAGLAAMGAVFATPERRAVRVPVEGARTPTARPGPAAIRERPLPAPPGAPPTPSVPALQPARAPRRTGAPEPEPPPEEKPNTIDEAVDGIVKRIERARATDPTQPTRDPTYEPSVRQGEDPPVAPSPVISNVTTEQAREAWRAYNQFIEQRPKIVEEIRKERGHRFGAVEEIARDPNLSPTEFRSIALASMRGEMARPLVDPLPQEVEIALIQGVRDALREGLIETPTSIRAMVAINKIQGKDPERLFPSDLEALFGTQKAESPIAKMMRAREAGESVIEAARITTEVRSRTEQPPGVASQLVFNFQSHADLARIGDTPTAEGAETIIGAWRKTKEQTLGGEPPPERGKVPKTFEDVIRLEGEALRKAEERVAESTTPLAGQFDPTLQRIAAEALAYARDAVSSGRTLEAKEVRAFQRVLRVIERHAEGQPIAIELANTLRQAVGTAQTGAFRLTVVPSAKPRRPEARPRLFELPKPPTPPATFPTEPITSPLPPTAAQRRLPFEQPLPEDFQRMVDRAAAEIEAERRRAGLIVRPELRRLVTQREIKLSDEAIQRLVSAEEERVLGPELTRATLRLIRRLEDLEGGRDLATQISNHFLRAQDAQITTLKRFGQKALVAANVARAIRASGDLSAIYRQGALLFWRFPAESMRAVASSVRAMVSERYAEEVQRALDNRPLASLGRRHGLTPRALDPGAFSMAQEEFVGAALTKHIPIIGRIVSASNRAYVTYLNKVQSDAWHQIVGQWLKLSEKGKINLTDADLDGLARFLNSAVGNFRAKSKAIDEALAVSGTVFFSPRLALSRFAAFGALAHPSPLVRREAAKAWATFLGTNLTILGLGQAFGLWDVELDPRSTDFGQMRIGNTRFDPWAGFRTTLVPIVQLITGKRKRITKPGFQSVTPREVLGGYLENKLSPGFGWLTDVVEGRDISGRNPLSPEQIVRGFTPLSWEDVADAYLEGSETEALWAIPLGTIGFGVSTIPPQKSALRVKLPPTAEERLESRRRAFERRRIRLLEAGR